MEEGRGGGTEGEEGRNGIPWLVGARGNGKVEGGRQQISHIPTLPISISSHFFILFVYCIHTHKYTYLSTRED